MVGDTLLYVGHRTEHRTDYHKSYTVSNSVLRAPLKWEILSYESRKSSWSAQTKAQTVFHRLPIRVLHRSAKPLKDTTYTPPYCVGNTSLSGVAFAPHLLPR